MSLATWKNFLAYVGGFYGNLSNYHNFGNNKFVPDVSSEDFKKILYSHPALNKPHYLLQETFDLLYPQVEKELFEYGSPYTQINFPHSGGITAYFSRNMTAEDLQLVSEFLKHQKIDVLNTRAFKSDDSHFLITIGSVLSDGSQKGVEFKGKVFDI